MKYFLLKSEEQALATPGAYVNHSGSISCNLGPNIYSNSITHHMFSLIVHENGNVLNSTGSWIILPWMIQEEISPKTHPEFFI